MNLCLVLNSGLWAQSEVEDPTRTRIVVRENPRTGSAYASIVPSDELSNRKIYYGEQRRYERPDYQMLNPKISPKDVGYQGPSSSRTKVYALAAGLAASGVLAGTLIPVSAGTAVGAGGSGAGMAAAGAGIAAGSISSALIASDPNLPDQYRHESSVRVIRPLPISSGSEA